LLGRPADRAAVAHARAQHLDVVLAEQARQFLRRGIVVADAHAGREADRAIDDVEMIRAVAGVLDVRATDDGADVRVRDRKVLPGVVAALVAHEVPVYAAVPRAPTLEDVYFAVEERTRVEEAAKGGLWR